MIVTWSLVEATARAGLEAALSRLELVDTSFEDTQYQRGLVAAYREILRLPQQQATDANLGDRD